MTFNGHFALNYVLRRYVCSSEAWFSKLGLQESLADAKVSARQQCVYEDPLAKKSTANLQVMVNSNRGRITYGLRIVGYFRV